MVLWTLEPVLILLLAWWLRHDRLSTATTVAAGLALLDAVLVVIDPGLRGEASGRPASRTRWPRHQPQLAHMMLQRAMAAGVAVAWFTADDAYGPVSGWIATVRRWVPRRGWELWAV